MFTKRKGRVREHERTEQGPDAIGDSAKPLHYPLLSNRLPSPSMTVTLVAPRQASPSAAPAAFTPSPLLTCRRADNLWPNPVCWSGTPALVFAGGPCCSLRRATRWVCPSCMLVNGTRQWDGVRTLAHSHSLSLSLPVTNTGSQKAVCVM